MCILLVYTVTINDCSYDVYKTNNTLLKWNKIYDLHVTCPFQKTAAEEKKTLSTVSGLRQVHPS